MIEVRNVTVVKSGQTLFKNLNFTCRAGEHWLITGANGSGKTILLELLAGIIHPTDGQVIHEAIVGKNWEERFQYLRDNILYIPTHALYTFVQGNEMFYQQRYYSIIDDQAPRVRDILKDEIGKLHQLSFPPSLSIDELLEIEVTRLSNGQLKKVLLLKKFAQQLPKVLLMDYPFEGLDAESRSDLATFIDHLATSHGTQFILTDQEHVFPQVINRKLVMQDFKIVSISEIGVLPRSSNDNKRADAVNRHGEPVVEMRKVNVSYGALSIIKDFDWTITKGERWALVGKNGSGKTTLFSLIYADHPKAYSNEIYLFGRKRGTGESIWDIKNRIAYMGPELINYLDAKRIFLSGLEYIMESIKGVDELKLKEAIDFLNASQFISKPVNQLSSGQLQILLLIAFFCNDRELLLMDEPFQFLDKDQKALVADYLVSKLNPESTLVLITHYEEDIARWTEKVMNL